MVFMFHVLQHKFHVLQHKFHVLQHKIPRSGKRYSPRSWKISEAESRKKATFGFANHNWLSPDGKKEKGLTKMKNQTLKKTAFVLFFPKKRLYLCWLKRMEKRKQRFE